MKSNRLAILMSGLLVVGLAGSLASQAPAGKGSRTPWGDPDLQGIYTHGITPITPLSVERWANRIAPNYHAPQTTHLELRELREMIIDPKDGKIPALTPEAEKKKQRAAEYKRRYPADSWESFSLWERCMTRALPDLNIPAYYGNTYQIFQTPQYVAILYEQVHEARIIPISGRGGAAASGVRQWLGNSVARWEGDTLVVETRNFTNKTEGDDLLHHIFAYYRAGENMQLVERFTRRDAENIDVAFTVMDPTVYTRPWTGAVVFTRDRAPDRVFEFACHEGNYRILANQLGLARAAEKDGRPPAFRSELENPPALPPASELKAIIEGSKRVVW